MKEKTIKRIKDRIKQEEHLLSLNIQFANPQKAFKDFQKSNKEFLEWILKEEENE